MLPQRIKAAGGGSGRGGGSLAAGDGQARAEGSSAFAIREQWLSLLFQSLPRISARAPPSGMKRELVEASLSLLLSTPAAPDFICD